MTQKAAVFTAAFVLVDTEELEGGTFLIYTISLIK